MNKDTLLNAINNYLLQIQIDSLGDITSKVNAVVTCRDYVANNDINDITADWIKSNLTVILPAITCYRKTLKNNIDEAILVAAILLIFMMPLFSTSSSSFGITH